MKWQECCIHSNAILVIKRRVGRDPLRIFVERAMGDRPSNQPPGICWEAYSTSALLQTVAAIVQVLISRNTGESSSSQAQPTPDLRPSSSSSTRAAEQVGEAHLVDPNCGYRCRFCVAACTRAPGHKLHSCYECRYKK